MIDAPNLSTDAHGLLGALPDLIETGWVRSTGSLVIDLVDPSTGRTVGTLPASTTDDVTRAVAAARATFEADAWAGLKPAERSRALHRLVDVLTEHSEALAEIGTLEVGSPITLSRGLHAGGPIAFFRWFADAALKGPMGGYEESLGLNDVPVLTTSMLFREPIGVVAAISAYNFPLLDHVVQGGWCAGGRLHGCAHALAADPAVGDRVRGLCPRGRPPAGNHPGPGWGS